MQCARDSSAGGGKSQYPLSQERKKDRPYQEGDLIEEICARTGNEENPISAFKGKSLRRSFDRATCDAAIRAPTKKPTIGKIEGRRTLDQR